MIPFDIKRSFIMSAFTLRLEPPLAKKLERVCREKGYSKTGLVKSLIRDFLERTASKKNASSGTVRHAMPSIKGKGGGGLASLVGIVSLGGDSVLDKRHVFE
jgi:hypothetical protein